MVKKNYDVLFVGGGLSASLLAISLLRRSPDLSVLMVERSIVFPNKLGESTSDATSLFLNRFKIDHILSKQTKKSGLRFLFNEANSANPKHITELSIPSIKSITNGYHINRSQFDADLLEEATKLGAQVLRPAEVINLAYKHLNSSVTISHDDTEHTVSTTWIIDASGTARIGGSAMNWKSLPVVLNTATIFAQVTNASSIDITSKDVSTYWNTNSIGPKSNSTMHYLRPGAWWWQIKRGDGQTSIGIVYDTSIVSVDKPEEYFLEIIREDEDLKRITSHANITNIQHRKGLPYISERLYMPGIAVIGDAACFIDPLFSPGIEFMCQQTLHLEELLTKYFSKKEFDEKSWNKYESLFLKAFKDRTVLYKNRYKILGSYDIFTNWIQLDLFVYFTFSIIPSVLFPKRLKYPLKFNKLTELGYRLMSKRYETIYHRRRSQGSVSSSLTQPGSLSYINVSSGFRILIQPFVLFYLWISNYMRIEFEELKNRNE